MAMNRDQDDLDREAPNEEAPRGLENEEFEEEDEEEEEGEETEEA